MYEKAFVSASNELGQEAPLTLVIAADMAKALEDKEDYEKAERLLTVVVKIEEKIHGPLHRDTLIANHNLGILHYKLGNFLRAKDNFMIAYSGLAERLGEFHYETGASIWMLSLAMSQLGEYEESGIHWRKYIAWCDRNPESGKSKRPDALYELGSALINAGCYEDAIQPLRECLDLRKSIYGDAEYRTLVVTARLLDALSMLNRTSEALELSQQACAAITKQYGSDDPEIFTQFSNQATIHKRSGDLESAISCAKLCLQGRELALGSEHPDTLAAIEDLSCLYRDKGEYDQAEVLCKRVLEVRERLLGPEHPDTSDTRHSLAKLLSDQQRYDESISLRRVALEVAAKRDEKDTLFSMHVLGCDLLAAGEVDEALELLQNCLAGREEIFGPEHADTLITVYNLAEVLSRLERRAEAIPLRRRDLAWCREQKGDMDPETLGAINGLAIDLREAGELREAEALFRESVIGKRQVLEPGSLQIGHALSGLAKTLELAGKLEEAMDYSQQALNHRLAHEGPDACWTNSDRLDLARILHKLGRDPEATTLLQELQESMARIEAPNDDDHQLMSDAADLQRTIDASS